LANYKKKDTQKKKHTKKKNKRKAQSHPRSILYMQQSQIEQCVTLGGRYMRQVSHHFCVIGGRAATSSGGSGTEAATGTDNTEPPAAAEADADPAPAPIEADAPAAAPPAAALRAALADEDDVVVPLPVPVPLPPPVPEPVVFVPEVDVVPADPTVPPAAGTPTTPSLGLRRRASAPAADAASADASPAGNPSADPAAADAASADASRAGNPGADPADPDTDAAADAAAEPSGGGCPPGSAQRSSTMSRARGACGRAGSKLYSGSAPVYRGTMPGSIVAVRASAASAVAKNSSGTANAAAFVRCARSAAGSAKKTAPGSTSISTVAISAPRSGPPTPR
jgi:hypothetical protein